MERLSIQSRTRSYPLNPVMVKLIQLMTNTPGLTERFNEAVAMAITYNLNEFRGVANLSDWILWCNDLLYWIPNGHDLDPKITAFYFVLNQPPLKSLQTNFQNISQLTPLATWMVHFARELGKFLDTTDSLTSESLQSFYANPAFHMNEYMQDPSGWKTFNQFFARRVKPGYRPIASPNDDKIIVSVADSTFQGWWRIDEASRVTVKGISWPIPELLRDNPYANYFKGGIFMHSYLSPTDYHRFHVPMSGKIIHSSLIMGQVSSETTLTKTNGQYEFDQRRGDLIDPVGFQFYQMRGLIILETLYGIIAVLPIGMSLVSSVIINAEIGTYLNKGDEFGHFQCGGSDYIILFPRTMNVELTAQINIHYKQGTAIGYINSSQREIPAGCTI